MNIDNSLAATKYMFESLTHS